MTGQHKAVLLYRIQAKTGARRFYERRGFAALCLTDGTGSEGGRPDVPYRLDMPETAATAATALASTA